MFSIWEVVEELVAIAYEHGTKTISMSQIRTELEGSEQNDVGNVDEVRESLIELGYTVAV